MGSGDWGYESVGLCSCGTVELGGAVRLCGCAAVKLWETWAWGFGLIVPEEGLMGPWIASLGKSGSGAPHSAATRSAGGAHAS